jgi:hypothetical protein
MASFPHASPPTPCALLYPPPYVPHALPISLWSCDSQFRVITRLWALRQDIIFYTMNVQTGSGGLPNLLYSGYWVYFLGVGRREREFYYSPPSSAQVRSRWSFTSTYPVSFRDVARDSYIFLAFRRDHCFGCKAGIGN